MHEQAKQHSQCRVRLSACVCVCVCGGGGGGGGGGKRKGDGGEDTPPNFPSFLLNFPAFPQVC